MTDLLSEITRKEGKETKMTCNKGPWPDIVVQGWHLKSIKAPNEQNIVEETLNYLFIRPEIKKGKRKSEESIECQLPSLLLKILIT